MAIKNLSKKDRKHLSSAYAVRGMTYLAMGDTIEGLNDYNQALKLNPTSTSLLRDRAQLYYEMDQFDLSDNDYRAMKDLDPGNTLPYMGLGRNALQQDRWEEAIDNFNYVIKLNSGYSSGYSFRAEAFMGQNNLDAAIDDIIKALAIDGDQRAYYLMLELPKEALPQLKTKLKIQMTKDPKERIWPYFLGVITQNNDEFQDAINYYEIANKLDASSYLLEKIAECYKELKRYQKALEYVDRALAINPEDDDVIKLKADILALTGQYDQSFPLRDQYIAANPEYPLAYRVMKDV
ncbi:MAG: tetratricopeptide repeat protein [Muribaculaceae bacterium]|nr:tetratricopeptide repeat protein [Muribaculaceae bacterium]